ncbi:MAG: V/A-type H+/Na+-transporting ATPase subunit [Tenuifilum sp.]|jgi:V/A-type H+-transporting ATPase subunit E|uniref:hypothetical protein n=1 Tax=Tenuifilum sp. TaxID=2760880 RepID=UPI0024AB3DD4|nr:hypothetical protein [Tenuifilum sp.]MDI3527394.1 V/A-type H+/Na+-transporting ATPase subunit [Tenuifilum sp.]
MQNKLQELTEKIYREGLEKGQAEANQLVAKAKEEAEKILSEAKSEAEKIVAAAKKEAEDYRKNIDTEVTLSAKQVINGLKQQITSMIEAKLYETPVVDALKDADFVKKVIETAVNRWDPNSAEAVSLQVLVPEDMAKAVADHFTAKAQSIINKEVEVKVDKAIKYGFRIGPKDGSYVVSFTDTDFENLFKDFMRPKIVALLFGGK